MTPTSERFYQLFRGRKDAYGTWQGGRALSYNSDGVSRPKAVTPEHFERHLTSTQEHEWIGVYPLGVEKCSWGCIDIDGKDFRLTETEWDWDRMYELAVNLCTVLAVKDVFGHIERTRNGYHVWVFPEGGPCSARHMRRALMAACTALDYNPKEVNPKAEKNEHGKIGNYVRLPYYGALSDGPDEGWPTPETPASQVWQQPDRYFIPPNEPDRKYSLESFLDNVRYSTPASIEEVSKLWTPPVKKYTVNTSIGLDAESMTRGLNGLGYTIWKDGPLPGSDRSSTLSHLAHLCCESGLTVDQAFAIIQSADLRWAQKFCVRSDGQEQMMNIVERAYAS